MKFIERTQYLDRLIGLKNTPDIKIITGIRRCGKSELMKAYMAYLKENDNNANIIYVDFFDLNFEEYKDYKALNKYVSDNYEANKNNYLFVDEVQLCDKFELVINSLHNSGLYDIYITGSNAFLLSSDLATLFTGRFIEIKVFPFSFAEYSKYYGDEKDIQSLFDKYVMNGGLSGSYVYKNDEDKKAYINDVYTTIVKRDLIDKYHLADNDVLSHLAEFLMDNVSNLTSPNKVSDTLVSNKISTNHITIGNYIKYLCNAYMFYCVKRYDIKGKKYLDTSYKYYLNDLGFRYSLLGSRNMDFGRAYENIVCLELLRRGYEVYVGKLYQKEVDFIAMKGSSKFYIQVSDDISNPDTFNREIDPLLKVHDAYPKMIIARTKHDEYDYEGVKIIDLASWLLDK